MGNPAIFPFFRATEAEDVLIVQINPVERPATPHRQTEIMNRINEITFNSSLLAEFRAIDFVTRMIDQGRLPHAPARRDTAASTCTALRSNSTFKPLTAGSKLNSDFDFFQMLHEGGRRARGFPHCAFRRHRRALDVRSRRRGEGRVGVNPSPRSGGEWRARRVNRRMCEAPPGSLRSRSRHPRLRRGGYSTACPSPSSPSPSARRRSISWSPTLRRFPSTPS